MRGYSGCSGVRAEAPSGRLMIPTPFFFLRALAPSFVLCVRCVRACVCTQLDQDKINALTNRMDEAVKERMELQERLDESEAKTNEFVNYFQVHLG